MSFRLLTIGPSPEATLVAPSLAKTHHVHLLTEPGAASPAGFLPSPLAVDQWHPTEASAAASIEAALSELIDAGLSLELTDLATFGVERVIAELYFPLLVPHGYAEASSAVALNLPNFRARMGGQTLLAWAAWQGRPVAAWLLQSSRLSPVQRYSHPQLPGDPRSLDLVASVTTAPLAPAHFAWAVKQMLASEGYTWVRRREPPWITTETLARWVSLDSGDGVLAYEAGAGGDHLSWCEARLAPGEGVLAFALGPEGLVTTTWGASTPWPVLPGPMTEGLRRAS